MARFGRRFPVPRHITPGPGAAVHAADTASAAELSSVSASLPGTDAGHAADLAIAAGELLTGADAGHAADLATAAGSPAVSADAASGQDLTGASVVFVYSAGQWIS